MDFNLRKDSRKLHRWGGILIALPFLVVLISGLFLQVKKEFNWIQPTSQTGSAPGASLSLDRVLVIAKSIPELEIKQWSDIDRLDVRPDDGVIKIRATNSWETQIDAHTGQILHTSKRRSDIIEKLHDGSWFHEKAKLGIFLPSAVIVAFLWLTGIYLFIYPYFAKRKNRRKLKKRKLKRRKKNIQPEVTA